MMITNTDRDLHDAVLDALEAEPRVEAGKIGIAVENGVVTLSGTLQSFTEKWAAEAAVKRVKGVCGIANELRVDLAGMHQRDDADIAKSAVDVLRWSAGLPQTIQAEVHDGYVTLHGQVDWAYQREDAIDAIRRLTGVRGIYDDISLKPYAVSPKELLRLIEARFQRLASFDAKGVAVEVDDDGSVTLSGSVHSLAERDEAESAAYSIPGTVGVVNDVIVNDEGW
ncbi:MAG TPA: BON domain-containing protein [Candidatus Tyrphobacter sp.]